MKLKQKVVMQESRDVDAAHRRSSYRRVYYHPIWLDGGSNGHKSVTHKSNKPCEVGSSI